MADIEPLGPTEEGPESRVKLNEVITRANAVPDLVSDVDDQGRLVEILDGRSESVTLESQAIVNAEVLSFLLRAVDGRAIAGITERGQFRDYTSDTPQARLIEDYVYEGETLAIALTAADGSLIVGATASGRIVAPLSQALSPDPTYAWALVRPDRQTLDLGLRADGMRPFIRGLPPRAALPDVTHVAMVGQSKIEGGDSCQPLSTANSVYGDLMFARGIRTWIDFSNPTAPTLRGASEFDFVPLREGRDYSSRGETPASSISAQLKCMLAGGGRFAAADLTGMAPHFLFSYPHRGARFLRELGPMDYGTTGHHATYVDDIRRGKASANARGLTYGVGAIVFSQGDGEGSGVLYPGATPVDRPTLIAAHKADLLTCYQAWDADARAISGQSRPIPLIMLQAWTAWSGAAQHQFAQEQPNVFMASPLYFLPTALNESFVQAGSTTIIHGSPLHHAVDGQRWIGAQLGKVTKRVLDGQDWRPTEPVDCWRVSDTEIRVKYFVPHAPLRFETGILPIANGYGFQVNLGTPDSPGAARTVTAVAIVAPDEVAITLAGGTPVGSGAAAFVSYGLVSEMGQTASAATAVQSGAAYPSGAASTEVVFPASEYDRLAKPLVDGVYQLLKDGANYMHVRDVRISGSDAIARGETAEITGTLTAGATMTLKRPQSFGNLCDSDPTLCVLAFAQGPRAGTYMPLSNFAVIHQTTIRS